MIFVLEMWELSFGEDTEASPGVTDTKRRGVLSARVLLSFSQLALHPLGRDLCALSSLTRAYCRTASPQTYRLRTTPALSVSQESGHDLARCSPWKSPTDCSQGSPAQGLL